METNTLLLLILVVLTCGFAVVSYRLTAVTRTLVLATGAAGEVLHRDVGHLENKVTELLGEIGEMIRPLTKDIHTVMLSTGDIESEFCEAARIVAGNWMQIVKVLEDLHPLRDLIELAKSVEHDLVGLAAIPVHLRTIEQTLETIAHNTSSEVP